MEPAIYLDYNATTPVDPAVVEAMVPYLFERFGNPSSAHAYGYQAHEAMDVARRQIANLVNARPSEIVFTGGGSETDNLAIKGVVFQNLDRRPHVVASVVDHPAVVNTLQYLKRRFAVDVTLLPVDEDCLVSPQDVRAAIRSETVLISIMHGNNEVGTIQPIREIAAIGREYGVPVHVDAAQSCGKVPVDVEEMGVDLLTIVSHKLYGPKGIAALFVRRGLHLDPLIHGSSQEQGMRAGTENVSSMVGFGAAASIAAQKLADGESERLAGLRDALQERLGSLVPGTLRNGPRSGRLPNTLNVSLPGAPGQMVLAYAPGVAASTGAACKSGSPEPSAVLLAMGLPVERAQGAIRLSLGRWTCEADVNRAAELLAEAWAACTAMPATG